jgi:hypothetical protein
MPFSATALHRLREVRLLAGLIALFRLAFVLLIARLFQLGF